MTNNLILSNRVKTLIGILVISLLGNVYLIAKMSSDENKIISISRANYNNFFQTLWYYNNSLDYFANNDSQVIDDRERELQALYVHSFSLLEYARIYAMLSSKEDQLPNLIWNFAVYIQDITNNLNKTDIKNNKNELKEFSKTISEIVELENQTRIEMLINNKGFVEKEMYTLLSPKFQKIMEFYLSNE